MPDSPIRPQIDYLARDFNSLRQLLLDQLALSVPDWSERHTADLGITLVELLAYAGDYLAYYQDAVAAEAYLVTARQRASLRRHARLLDYAINDGVSARTYVHFDTAEDKLHIPAGASLLTESAASGPIVSPALLPAYDGIVFETMHGIDLYRAGNAMPLLATETTLPAGATSAALHGHFPHLAVGDVLIFEQSAIAPDSVQAVKPHAVRLCKHPVLEGSSSATRGRLPHRAVQAITRIEWFDGDALPSPFVLTTRLPDGRLVTGLTVALGNNALAQHGRKVREPAITTSGNKRADIKLVSAGIAFGVPYLHSQAVKSSAADSLTQDPAEACAAISLHEAKYLPGNVPSLVPPPAQDQPVSAPRSYLPSDSSRSHAPLPLNLLRGLPSPLPASAGSATPASPQPIPLPPGLVARPTWTPRRDLIASSRFSRDFVAEIDNDGLAHLRFGDGEHGRVPAPGTVFSVNCRVGLGSGGNVAAGAIQHIVTRNRNILGVRNPIPALGGMDPETPNQIRINAPRAFRRQRRCITEQDYASRALAYPEIGSAVAIRNGRYSANAAVSGDAAATSTVTVYIVRTDRKPSSHAFRERVRSYLHGFALIGDEVKVLGPELVPFNIEVGVTPLPNFSPSLVRSQVQEKIQEKIQAQSGYQFGQPVQVSLWTSIAASVPGVANVTVTVSRTHSQGGSAPVYGLSHKMLPQQIAVFDAPSVTLEAQPS
jgi:hypothetical protein